MLTVSKSLGIKIIRWNCVYVCHYQLVLQPSLMEEGVTCIT